MWTMTRWSLWECRPRCAMESDGLRMFSHRSCVPLSIEPCPTSTLAPCVGMILGSLAWLDLIHRTAVARVRGNWSHGGSVQPYSRLQSGVGQGVSSSPRQRRSPATQSPRQPQAASPATSFASVVTRHPSSYPASRGSPAAAPAYHEQARQLAQSHPWAGEDVLQACPAPTTSVHGCPAVQHHAR